MGTCGTEQATITNSINTTCMNISRESEDNNETTESDDYYKLNEIKEYKVTKKELNSSIYSKFQWLKAQT